MIYYPFSDNSLKMNVSVKNSNIFKSGHNYTGDIKLDGGEYFSDTSTPYTYFLEWVNPTERVNFYQIFKDGSIGARGIWSFSVANGKQAYINFNFTSGNCSGNNLLVGEVGYPWQIQNINSFDDCGGLVAWRNQTTGAVKCGDYTFNDINEWLEFVLDERKPFINRTTVDFTAYVDGNTEATAPNIAATAGLTWVANINDNPNNLTKDDLKISYQFFAGNLNNHRLSDVVHYAPYGQKSISFSYYDIIKEVLPDLYKKIITGDARIGEQAIVGCVFWAWTDFELDNYFSGKFGFDFYFNGFYENDNTYGNVGDGAHYGSIIVKTGQLVVDDEYKPFPNTYPNIPLEDMSVNTLNLISKSYSVSPNRLKQLNNALWGSDFIDNIKLVNNNPIENIVSIKMFPFTISGAEENILLGNVDTAVKGLTISTAETYRHSFGKVTIPQYYKSFLDLHNTNIDLYLPFIGFITLDPYRVTGEEVEVQYIIDLLTGMVKAIVLCNDIVISESSCQIGIDIPLSASNRASWEISQLINTASTAVDVVTDVASGNFGMGTMSNIANTVVNSVTSPHKTITRGSFSSICSAYSTLVPFIIIDRPTYQENTAFNHTKGRCCFLTKTLKNLSGFTIIDGNTDLSGISCLADEKNMILNILSSGFYI